MLLTTAFLKLKVSKPRGDASEREVALKELAFSTVSDTEETKHHIITRFHAGENRTSISDEDMVAVGKILLLMWRCKDRQFTSGYSERPLREFHSFLRDCKQFNGPYPTDQEARRAARCFQNGIQTPQHELDEMNSAQASSSEDEEDWDSFDNGVDGYSAFE